MANWTKNIIRFYGKQESVNKIKSLTVVSEEYLETLKKRNEELIEEFRLKQRVVGDISFNILIPTPTNIFQGDFGKAEEKKYRYDWNRANWGCKWDTEECEVYENEDGTLLELTFWTAWNIPDKWFEEICHKADEIGGVENIDGEFADEDFGNEMGYIRYDFNEHELHIQYSDYDKDLYEDVWGEGMFDFYDEEEEDGEEDCDSEETAEC